MLLNVMKIGLLFISILFVGCNGYSSDDSPGQSQWVNPWNPDGVQPRVDENGDPLPFVCVGVEVPESAYGLAPGPMKEVEAESDAVDDGNADALDGEVRR